MSKSRTYPLNHDFPVNFCEICETHQNRGMFTAHDKEGDYLICWDCHGEMVGATEEIE